MNKRMKHVYSGNRVEIYQLSPKLYFREGDLHGRLQCNSFFIVGKSSVCVVDPPSMEAAAEIRGEVAQLIGKPIQFILITHNHLDHAAGLPDFLKDPVVIFCSYKCVEELSGGQENVRAAFVGVRGSLTLHLEGLLVELEALDESAHSPCDMLVRIPEENAVCTGDLAVTFEDLYFHTAVPERWAAKLREYSKGADEILLPGHGGVYSRDMFSETADFIDLLIRSANEIIAARYPNRGDALKADAEGMERAARDFLSGGSAEAAVILDKAKNDAQRVVFMMLRNFLSRRLL
jgi:glyoxylase-like metal-dependent hydrolase (beta-lactamase superfamily II)